MGQVGSGVVVKLASDTIGEVTHIGTSGGNRAMIDVSSADSTNLIREFLGGFVTPPKLSITIRCNATAAALLESHYAAGAEENCLITLDSGDTFDADGIMDGLDDIELAYDGDVVQTFSFQCQELLDFTAAG